MYMYIYMYICVYIYTWDYMGPVEHLSCIEIISQNMALMLLQ